MATEKTDVVIVGVGAAGGILAAELGKAGMKVIGLERGPRLTTQDFDPHDDFRARSHTIARYGASAIPEHSSLADWPLSYAELEPYYGRAEYELGVSGKAGNLQEKRSTAATCSKRRAVATTRCRRCAWTRAPSCSKPRRASSAITR